MEEEQRRRFEQALERKQEEAERKAAANQPGGGEGEDGAELRAHDEQLVGDDRPPDTLSPRDKSTGKGKKTADKWNQ